MSLMRISCVVLMWKLWIECC